MATTASTCDVDRAVTLTCGLLLIDHLLKPSDLDISASSLYCLHLRNFFEERLSMPFMFGQLSRPA
jgi:hypothetical protein